MSEWAESTQHPLVEHEGVGAGNDDDIQIHPLFPSESKIDYTERSKSLFMSETELNELDVTTEGA